MRVNCPRVRGGRHRWKSVGGWPYAPTGGCHILVQAFALRRYDGAWKGLLKGSWFAAAADDPVD